MKYSEFLTLEQDKPCPFCTTGGKERILENESAYLTFAIAPYHTDHLLVVPKRHIEHILDVTAREMLDANDLENRAWKLLQKLGHSSVSFIVREGNRSGRTITHLHFHIIPEVRLGDLDHNGDERRILRPAEVAQLVSKLRKII